MIINRVYVAVMTLSKLKKNQRARIKSLPNDLGISARLMEQGFFPNSEIALAHKAPFTGPLAYYLHGTKISLQHNLAAQINVELV